MPTAPNETVTTRSRLMSLLQAVAAFFLARYTRRLCPIRVRN